MFKRLIGLGISLSILISGIPVGYAADYQTVEERGITTLQAEDFYTGSVLSSGGRRFISYNVGGTVNFRIKVTKAGRYYLKSEAGTTTATATVQFSVDGKAVLTGKYTNTGSYNRIQLHELGVVELTEGEHVLTSVIKTSSMHFDSVILEPYQETELSEGAYKKHVLPTIIQAEDFDFGVSGYKGANGANDGGAYRTEAGIDIYSEGSGYYITLTDEEFTRYTFTAEYEGVYTIYLKSPQMSEIDVYIDGYTYPIKAEVENGDAESEICSLYFEEGVHTVRLVGGEIQRAVPVDYIRFATSVSKEYLSPEDLDKGPLDLAALQDESDAEHPIYKEIYVAPDGSDSNKGEKDSPFATIERARQEAKKYSDKMTGDIIINIASGEYKFADTLRLDVTDSGKNGYDIIYRGEDKYNPSVINGGREITGWTKYNDVIWKAPLSDAGEVRNLYINEQPAVRARSKYAYLNTEMYNDPGTIDYVNDGFKVSKKNFPTELSRPSDLELVWYNSWASQRTPVRDILRPEGDKVIFLMEQPYFHIACIEQAGTPCAVSANKLFYIENAMELLDEPGEFYYNPDEGMIYYYPFMAEDMTTAETYIGEKEFFMDIRGNSDSERIENITFQNLSFKYGVWNEPSERGMFTIQATSKRAMELTADGKTKSMMMPAQVAVNYSDNVNFLGCEFICLGSEALSMNYGVNNSTIDGCLFRDLSAGAITCGNAGKVNYNGYNINITNNVFRRIGVEYPDSVALTMYYCRGSNILNNDIRDTPYTGISVGWGWGLNDPAGWGYINISYNYIDDCMNTLEDGTHIYVLGKMRGSQISYNYTGKCAYDEDDTKLFDGVYTDEGSDLMEIHHNVFDGVPGRKWWQQNKVKAPKAYNNYSVSETHVDSSTGATIENHTYLKEGSWPQEALDIKANAGVGSGYEYLLEKAEKATQKPNRNEELPDKAYASAEARSWIEAEDYNEGGEGVAYNDNNSDVVNLTSSLYPSGGYMVQDTSEGEWINYDFTVPEDGEYVVQVRAGHGWKDVFAGCSVYIDEVPAVEDFPITSTTWSKLDVFTVAAVNLTAGKHTLRYEFRGSGTYLDALRVIAADSELLGEATYENEDEFDEGIMEYEEVIPEEQPEKASFSDIVGHWAEEDILLLTDMGVIRGISSELFAPGATLTKRQAILLTLRAMEIKHDEALAAEKALELGITDSMDGIDEVITREEYADIMMNAYLNVNPGFVITASDSTAKDFGLVGEGYIASVLGATELGLIIGDENGLINPRGTLTRAEAATMTKRLINKR